MKKQITSNVVMYQYALDKGIQAYIKEDCFAPSRWSTICVILAFDKDTIEVDNAYVMDDVEQIPRNETSTHNNFHLPQFENDPMEDGEIQGDSSCYSVL